VLGASVATFGVWAGLLFSHSVPLEWLPPAYRQTPFVLAFTLGVSTMVRGSWVWRGSLF
jgi:hypothetical protein